MNVICKNLMALREKICDAENLFQRQPFSVSLLAVSKGRSVDEIREAIQCEQTIFGENRVQEAILKIKALKNEKKIEWHFIGPVQSNKTILIARYFSWVHSVDRLKIAKRLNEQRANDMPPLNICIEVNIDDEQSKSGIPASEVVDLAYALQKMKRLKLRGLMALPLIHIDVDSQRVAFRKLFAIFENLKLRGFQLDTLSMGMTNDFEAAIAEGATIVRVGTGIFGSRDMAVS